PVFQFVLNRFGVWWAGIGALATAAIAVLLAWLVTRTEPLPPLALAFWIAGVLAVLALAGSLMRLPAMMLRWDGRQWWLADKAGDVRAFEMLVVKYQRRIERLIGRMVRDVDLVPDIAQETFIRAYRALLQFRGESAFYTWLYRIAVNTAKKSLMELKRDPLVT